MPDTLLVVPAAPAGSMESLENRMMEPACRRARVARSEAGFSLIELLVAVAVMMIISGIVMQALLQMTTAQGMVANRTRMHASIRSATSLLQQEVGQAGRVSLPGAMTLTAALAATGAQTVTVTSVAGIFVNEHDDPSVVKDVMETLDRMVPRQGPYKHAEGNSDAHIKSIMVGSSVQVPIQGGWMNLGRWQGIFLAEFDGPRTRNVQVIVRKA